ncbi:MAG: tyrosine-type recombinase/integrase [Ruminococcus sp.]|jgi:site-specific recombinase XerD|nr:tyrosine-type recombinase/integrase [Ruminococcus sp.]
MYKKEDCPDFLNSFITYQRVILMKSEATISAYYSDLQIFLRFLLREQGKDDSSIKEMTVGDLKKVTKLTGLMFLNYIASDRQNNARSRKRKLAALNTFFKCLVNDLDILTENPIQNISYPKLPVSMPKFLSFEESKALLSGISPDNPFYLRDYCIVTLFVNCGMRLSELVGLNLTSINLDSRNMRLLGKGNKERIIHINDACAFAILDYINVRLPADVNPEKVKDPDALFLSKQLRRITGRRVEQIVENALAACHLDGRDLSVHKLRHTAATLMYNHGGADALTLKEILGHKSVSTTEIYTHIAPERISSAMDNNPLANIKHK